MFRRRHIILPQDDVPFSPTATRNDIAACFRLILGRNPNPEERSGHFARIGEDLTAVVASYVSSLEFAERRLTSQSPEQIVETTLNGIVMFVDAQDQAVGRGVLAGAYEPEVMQAIRALLAPGMGVIDLGANIGAISLLAASLVGETGFVLAVEPNARNAKLLEASRRRNGFSHVVVCQCAAAPTVGLLVLHASFSNGTTSSLGDDPIDLAGAMTVPALPPDLLIPAGRRIELIKVDVEGAEYLALRGCLAVIERDRPVIVSEFSPGMLPGISGVDGPGYLGWLASLGYAIRVIKPDGNLSEILTIEATMRAHADRGTDHIDIVARA